MIKIKQIQINGFGKWSQQTFDFVDGFQAIMGPNESGKSTIRAFIVSMLFGFPTKKTQTNVYDPKDGSQYGGHMIADFSGRVVKITRVDRIKSRLTITDLSTGEIIDNAEEWLKQRLAPLNRQMFDAVFNFNQKDLSTVMQLSKNDLHQVLLNISALGSNQWLRVAQKLEKEASSQFSARRTGKRSLNILSRNYVLHEQQLVQQRESGIKYIEQDEQIKQLLSQQAILTEQLNQISNNREAFQIIYQKFDLYQEANQIKNKVSQDSVHISYEDEIQFRTLQNDINLVKQTLKDLELEHKSDKEPTLIATDTQAINHISKARIIQQRLKLLQKSYDHLSSRQNNIEQQFSGDIPAVLSVDESNVLVQQPNQLWGMFGVAAVMAMVWFKPLLLVAVLIGGYGSLKYRKRAQYIKNIKDRYQGLSLSRIQSLQSDLRQLPELQTQMSEILLGIQKQLGDVKVDLEVIAQQYNCAIDITTVDSLEIALFDLQYAVNQAQMQNQTSNSIRMQTQKQLDERIQRYELQLQKLRDDINSLFTRVGVLNTEQFQDNLRISRESDRLNQRYHDIMNQFTAEECQQLSKFDDKETFNQVVNQLDQQYQDLKNQINKVNIELSELKAKQQYSISTDQIMSLQQDLSDEKSELLAQFGEFLATKLTAKWIEEALMLSSQNRFPKMQSQASMIFSQLTNKKYDRIQISDANGIVVMTKTDQIFTIAELSTGTQEQLYVALRLALSAVLSDTVSVPLLIDDGFVNFDNTRRQVMLDILQKLARNQQIFYFTTDFSESSVSSVLDLRKRMNQ